MLVGSRLQLLAEYVVASRRPEFFERIDEQAPICLLHPQAFRRFAGYGDQHCGRKELQNARIDMQNQRNDSPEVAAETADTRWPQNGFPGVSLVSSISPYTLWVAEEGLARFSVEP